MPLDTAFLPFSISGTRCSCPAISVTGGCPSDPSPPLRGSFQQVCLVLVFKPEQDSGIPCLSKVLPQLLEK